MKPEVKAVLAQLNWDTHVMKSGDSFQKACADDELALDFLENMRWRGRYRCIACDGPMVYQMMDCNRPVRTKRKSWRCRECHSVYTVRTGTILEHSKIPLRHWCFILGYVSLDEGRLTGTYLQRKTGLSYKACLSALHRIGVLDARGKINKKILMEALDAFSDLKTTIKDLSHHFGVSSGTLYQYLNGDGTLKRKGKSLFGLENDDQQGFDAEFPEYIRGQALKKFRESRGDSIRKCAQKVGLHPSHVYRIERGERGTTILVLKKYSAGYSIPMAELAAIVHKDFDLTPPSRALR